MHLPAGPAGWPANAALARFLLDVHTDLRWILRRVETVAVLSSQLMERRTTLDVDCAELRRRAAAAGIADHKILPIPLALLPKSLLLDIDVRDDCNNAMSVAVSDRDSAASELIMLAHIEGLGKDPSRFNPLIHQKLFEIAASMPSRDDVDALASLGEGSDVDVDAWRIDPGLTISLTEVDQWRALFDDDDFASLVITFSLQYLLMTHVDTASQEVQILKLRQVEATGEEPEKMWQERLGLTSFVYLVDTPAVGRAAREHFRLLAPAGMFLEGAVLVDLGEGAWSGSQRAAPAISSNSYTVRSTPERAILYSKGVRFGYYAALVSMRTNPSGFVRPALLSVLASLLLIAGGLWAEHTRNALSGEASSVEAAVAILLIFPSILSAYIVREGEHEIVRYLMFYPRLAVTGSAAATITASGAVVVQLSSTALQWTWAACGFINLLTFALLLVINTSAENALKTSQARSGQTTYDRVPRF